MKISFPLLVLMIVLMGCNTSSKKTNIPSDYNSYLAVGTYTDKGSEGVYMYKFNTETGENVLVSSIEVENPSYLTFSEDEAKLYVVTESDNEEVDCLSVLGFDKENGELSKLQTQLTKGRAPCYVLNDTVHNKIFTANYMGGSISQFELDGLGLLNGEFTLKEFKTSLGPVTDRQEHNHLHCVYLSPDNKFLFANDLGADCIYQFDLTQENFLNHPEVIQLAAGVGPRHTVFHPNNKWAYLITELSGEVMAFNYDGETLNLFQTILADPEHAAGSGDIRITPNGKFLYASNRLVGDGVTIFSIDEQGMLTSVGYQKTGVHPRNMSITPNGKYLLVACRDSNLIEVYSIDSNTGRLKNTNNNIEVSMPVCLQFASLD